MLLRPTGRAVRTSRIAAPLLLLGALTLTGCGSDDASDTSDAAGADDAASATTTTESPSASESATDTSSEESSSAAAAPAAGDTTPPGTQLSFGQTATVPVEYAKGSGTVAFTVTGIRRGTTAQLTKAGVKDAKGITPYYVDVEMKLVSGEGLGGYRPTSDLNGFIGDSPGGTFIAMSEYAPCVEKGLDLKATAGATAKTCIVALAPGDAVVDSAQFYGGPDSYDQFKGKPVVWK